MQKNEEGDFQTSSPSTLPRERDDRHRIAVVIPCYRVEAHLPTLLKRIGGEVSMIYCVIDGCPHRSEDAARAAASLDSRIRVLVHQKNSGVGAAVLTGMQRALEEGADVIVKLDGDGQMDPDDIPCLVRPILDGEADYVKGNRFFHLDDLRQMPWLRTVGNAGLSFLTKLSSGYWNLFDPTNGFTAIHRYAAQLLCEEPIAYDYFFESDVLFRLNTVRAVVQEVPLPSRYGFEKSHLNPYLTLIQFPFQHLDRLVKRIFYNYFLRDFNFASIQFLIGIGMLLFGICFGSLHWARGYRLDQLATPGTVMLAALPVILGWISLISFCHYDMLSIPKVPLLRVAHCKRRQRPWRHRHEL